ncbi:hypothetical protein ZIOFF_048358 [Zingiber officinale]|uniref:Uncharacterized protein n=1 Tax=Zingiber officinale TaxID=94328 RepID=A0A8J5G7N4_ZINOF|nr:hypothetical protein ZIOFF_048358 [Zingiber officinale]
MRPDTSLRHAMCPSQRVDIVSVSVRGRNVMFPSYQEEVLERAKKAKEKAALEVMGINSKPMLLWLKKRGISVGYGKQRSFVISPGWLTSES